MRPVMHVAIEAARWLQERRGIGRYVRCVVRELAAGHPTLRLTCHVARPSDLAPMQALLVSLHDGWRSRAEVRLLRDLPQTDADVVWYPWNVYTVPVPQRPSVVTMHDIAPMLQLDHRWWKVLKRARNRRLFAQTVREADHLITDAAFTRDELVRHLDADPARITVVPLAADDLPLEEPPSLRPELAAATEGPFVLTVGGQEGRKNLTTLYDAMTQLWRRGVSVRLVQCGPGLSASTRRQAKGAPWFSHVGFVNDAELVALYRRACALVCPSRYEGFGLPVLEAMRAGAPVICTDASSLPEVAGDAALFVPWDDAKALAEAMARCFTDETLRGSLRARGAVQAARFSWRETARGTMQVFAEAMRRRGG